MRQILVEPAVPSVNTVKASDHFFDLWKHVGIQQLIPNSRFSQMPYDLYCQSLKPKVKKSIYKAKVKGLYIQDFQWEGFNNFTSNLTRENGVNKTQF